MRFQLREKHIEIYTAFLLAFASLVAAWCAYQAAAWSGEQTVYGAVVANRRLEASRALARSGQLEIVDALQYAQWLEAYRGGDTALANYLRARFRDEFRPAFEAWVKLDPENNPDAPLPFELPEYTRALLDEANAAEAAAMQAAQDVERANANSSAYVRDTLFTAMTLFLGAIAGRFAYPVVRYSLLLMATIMLVLGVVNAAMLPLV